VVARVADNAEVCRVPTPPAVADHRRFPYLSGDGRTLLLIRPGGEAHLWRLGESPERVAVVKDAWTADLRPDGRLAAVTHTDGWLSVLDPAGGGPAVRLPPTDGPGEFALALHPSEPRVVVSRYNDPPVVVVRDTQSHEVLARFTGYRPIGVAWHPFGSTLVVAGESEGLRVYDGKTFRETAVWPVRDALAILRFNPSGDRLAGLSWSATAHLIDAHTGRTMYVSPPFRDGHILRWSPDGRRLAGPTFAGRIGIWEVGDGREFRVLHRLPAPVGGYGRGAVHPDGRLFAAAVGAGVALWDLETGRQVADLPLGSNVWQSVFDPAGVLWTPTAGGTFRWRVRESPDHPGRLTVGPPERVPVDRGTLGRSADARVWVGAERFRADAFVWRPDRPYDRGSLPAGYENQHVDVSPDGRWAVTAHHTTTVADLWDVPARQYVKRLHTRSGNALPAFSPDGKWLWVNSDGGRLLHVGTWEPGPVTGRGEDRPAFTPDGRVMALETGAGSVRLVRTADGRELVRLDNPHQDPLSGLAFTPDGTRLVGCSPWLGNALGVHVWDLRLIRRQLAARGLDWDAPPLPEPSAPAGPVEVRVPIRTPAGPPAKDENPLVTVARMTEYLLHDPAQVAPHHYRAHAWDRLGMAARAEADFDEAVRIHPNEPDVRECRGLFLFARGRYAEAAADLEQVLAGAPAWPAAPDLLNRVAVWHLVLAPADRRDPGKGLDLARRAVARDGKSPVYRITLGVALLRNGRPAEAVSALEEARANGGDRFDDLACPALALARLALGDRPRAAEALRQGAEAAGRLSAGRLLEYARLERGRLEAEAAAAYLLGGPHAPWFSPR
jgi:WD40 repeat protein/tetratricopeptide (TPR) repeat protein